MTAVVPQRAPVADRRAHEKTRGAEHTKKLEVHLLGGATCFLRRMGRRRRAGTSNPAEWQSVPHFRRQGDKCDPALLHVLSPLLHAYPPALGLKTTIEECTSDAYADLPLYHPFVDFSSLDRVQDALQACVLGSVTHQTGYIERATSYGHSDVCNAVLKHGLHEIRCPFWRQQGETLATFQEGQELALFQVTEKAREGSGELHASEATQIMPCPLALLETLRASTDIANEAGPPLSLSRRHDMDYDEGPAKAIAVSGLMSVPVSQMVRELPSLFEVHRVAVLGMTGLSSDGGWQIRSCAECKKKVLEAADACVHHPDVGTEQC